MASNKNNHHINHQAERVKANAPHRLAETTFVHRIFAGYLRSQVKCTSCGFCSNTYETFLDLSLEIHGRVGTLEEALARFTAVETLDKANRSVLVLFLFSGVYVCVGAWARGGLVNLFLGGRG